MANLRHHNELGRGNKQKNRRAGVFSQEKSAPASWQERFDSKSDKVVWLLHLLQNQRPNESDKEKLNSALSPDETEDLFDFTVDGVVGDQALSAGFCSRHFADADRWVDDECAIDVTGRPDVW